MSKAVCDFKEEKYCNEGNFMLVSKEKSRKVL